MENNRGRTVRTILVLFGIIFCFHFVSGFSLTEKFGFCEEYDFSLSECLNFWDDVSNLTIKYNISLEDISSNFNSTFIVNETVYVNQTEYVYVDNSTNSSFNCSSYYEEDLRKIDEYAKRGFEPVFENAQIINFEKIQNESAQQGFISEIECQARIDGSSSSVSSFTGNAVSNNQNSKSSDDEFYTVIGIGIVVLLVLFFVFREKLKEKVVEPKLRLPSPESNVSKEVEKKEEPSDDEFGIEL